MPQRKLDESIASKCLELVGIAVKRKCSMNAFRKNSQQLAALKHLIGALLAGHYAAQLGHEVGQEREFQQSRMGKKARISPTLFHQCMQRHYAVKRHESAMHAHQHSGAAGRNVFDAVILNAPIKLAHEFEQRFAIEPYVFFVHAEFVELRLFGGDKVVVVALMQE